MDHQQEEKFNFDNRRQDAYPHEPNETSRLSPEDELYFYHDVRGVLKKSSESGLATPTRRNVSHSQSNESYHSSVQKNIESDLLATRNENGIYGAKKGKINGTISILVSLLALAICVAALCIDTATDWWRRMHLNTLGTRRSDFDDTGRYVVEDFDIQPTFSDFLPGLAGIYGKPLYAFVVNRGQAIASFGIESKDYPILEFQSANKAYQTTPLLGFRTFIQGSRRTTGSFLAEPFSPLTANYPGTPTEFDLGNIPRKLPKRMMYLGENDLQLQEIDFQNQLETNVTYFILPEEDFGAFVRRTTFTNTDTREPLSLSVLDGLARMEPAGGRLDNFLKNTGQTLEGYMGVHFPYTDSITMPYYRLTIQPSDSTKVHVQTRGHYCLSFLEGNEATGNVPQLLPILYDTSKVFGEDTSLLRPTELFSKSIETIVNGPQYGQAKTPSCFGALGSRSLGPGETITISTFFGAADAVLDVPVIARRIMQEGFVLYKLTRTREVIRQITRNILTRTSHRLFDAHIQQMYLDNSLRGGIPVILGDQDDGMSNSDEDPRLKVFHVFSRIPGDLERDGDDFMLSPTFFSQGPGNFRDVVQNRRNDVFFNPRIGSFNVRMFLSFIQADGYEPSSVEAVVFTIDDIGVCEWIAESAVGRADGHRAQREALTGILNGGPFRPGQLFALMEEQYIELIISRQEFIDIVASAAESSPLAVHRGGFGADHWTYYVDMINSYLKIYPDGEQRLLYETELPYFFSPMSVQPRHKKYVLTLQINGYTYHVQQRNVTVEDPDKIKYMNGFRSEVTGWYHWKASWQDSQPGQKLKSSAAAKLFLLATLKFATRDAYGMGIEYEGGKPGWDEANNGLVGMLGSGMPETFELKVLLKYLLESTRRYGRSIEIPLELADLVDAINVHLDMLRQNPPTRKVKDIVPSLFFDYWDKVATAREEYREKVKVIFSGNTTTISAKTLSIILSQWLEQVNEGIERAISLGTGTSDNRTIPTYFAFEVTEYKRTGELNGHGHPFVKAKQLRVVTFPVFLEGPTRMMKTVDNTKDAQAIYDYVRNKSGLRDEKLSMYTISTSIQGQSIDMGRTVALPTGWAENQGVWLHMSYKFYLELLHHKLYDQFFEEATTGGLLPFMDSTIYGRSLTECSSFIVSSSFEDPSKRGRGFLARFSGSTAEFLSMWIVMFVGPHPFFVDRGDHQLRMQLIPAVPAWMFESWGGDELDSADDEEKKSDPLLRLAQQQHPNTLTLRFKLFSSIQVHYYNERRTDLFGIPPYRYRVGLRDGSVFDIDGPTIGVDLADKIRRVVFVDFIEAYF